VNLRKAEMPKLLGYYYPPVMGKHPSREVMGVATYVKANCNYERLEIKVPGKVSQCAVKLKTGQGDIKILNAYYPTGADTLWLKDVEHPSWLVVGDFNERDALWEDGFEGNSRSGADLSSAIQESDLVLLNDGSVTRLPETAGHSASALDLALVSPDLAREAEWSVEEDTMGSDHLPIVIHFSRPPSREKIKGGSKFAYERADWHKFRGLLSDSPLQCDGLESISVEEHYELLHKQLLGAATESIPKTNAGVARTKSNPWWTDDTEAAVLNKRYWTRRYRRDPCPFTFQRRIEAERECKQTIARAKRDHWRKFADDLEERADLSDVYKHIKRMKQQYVRPDSKLRDGDTVYDTAEEKANAFAEVFAKASSKDGLSVEMRDLREEHENRSPLQDEWHTSDDRGFNSPITRKEIDRALSSIKKVSVAEGPDQISYRILREVPNSVKDAILLLFQKCWDTGTIPKAWKHAIVSPIPKQGKPKHAVSSYRPISLTSHLGKVYERITKFRLEFYCESNGILPRCQAGFRKGRSVTDHIVKLNAHIHRALMRRRTMFACFFDVHRAYDQVWHHRLLEKLIAIGVNGPMYNFIKSFISDRTMQVKYKGALSSSKKLEMGVPQGSVIAPLLFSLMLHDIDTVDSNGAIVTLYADDLAVWRENTFRRGTNPSASNRIASLKQFQKAVSNLCEYMRTNGFTLSPLKTQFMVFKQNCWVNDFSIIVNGKNIPAVREARYLGVRYQWTGLSSAHVKHNIASAQRAVNLIKSLYHNDWANDPKIMVTLVKSLVRSRLTWGLEGCHSLSRDLWRRLTVMECRALKIALGLRSCTPNNLVYRDAGMLPIENEVKLQHAKYTFRAMTVPNSTSCELETEFYGSVNHTGYVPFADHVKELITAAKVDENKVAPRRLHPYPPWVTERANIQLSLEGLSKKDNPLLSQTVSSEFIANQYGHHLQIYTDGSQYDAGTGAAFVIPGLRRCTKRYHLPEVNIMTAELVAILMAANHVNDLGVLPTQIVILSDSLSALQAIASDGTNAREDIVREIQSVLHQLIVRGVDTTLQWVPAHVGVIGNELADRAAREAAGGDDTTVHVPLALAYADISAKLERAAWDDWRKCFITWAVDADVVDPVPPGKRGNFFRDVHTHLARIMYRIRTNYWQTKFVPVRCTCGDVVSFYHVIFQCQDCTEARSKLIELLDSLELPHTLMAVASRNEKEGWKPLVLAAELVFSCKSAAYL